MIFKLRFLLVCALLWISIPSRAAASSNQVRLQVEGHSSEGTPLLVLRWTAISNAIYKIQSRSTLSPSNAWQTLDAATSMSTQGIYRLPAEKPELKAPVTSFYRLVLPEPQLLKVEPAVWNPGGGSQIFVVGQGLGTNDRIRLGNIVIKPATLQTGSLYTFFSPALAEAFYTVEWLAGTNQQVIARLPYAVEVSSSIPGTQRLSEPPQEPPAAPRFRANEPQPWHVDNFRVQPFSGEFVDVVTDLQAPGRGLHFDFKRTYRSRTGRPTPLGNNWDFSYNIYIEPEGNDMAVSDGAGRRDIYFGQPDGSFTRPELFNQGGYSNSVFVLTFPDSGRWIFRPFDGSASSGKIDRIVDRNNNTMSFGYDGFGRLLTIVDPLNHTNRLAYTPAGLVQSVTDFAGRSVAYSYYNAADINGSDGDLRSVTTPRVIGTPNTNDYPGGKTTTYTYSRGATDERLNHNLLSIIDPKGQTWLQVRYDTNTSPNIATFAHVDAFRRGSNSYPETIFSYIPLPPSPNNLFAALKTIVNDPAGNVTEAWFDSRNRKIMHRNFAGRSVPGAAVTETQNRPGTKVRETDPDFWETRFEWNADSLCTQLVRGRGNVIQFTYEGDLNTGAAARHRADLRVYRKGCCNDESGNPGQVLIRRFEYDARFGSRGLEFDLAEHFQAADLDRMDKTLSNPLSSGGRFPTRIVDPRGSSDLCAYDPRGNLLQHQGRPLDPDGRPVQDFSYNSSGQFTSHVHFANATGYRRRDEFTFYPATGQFAFWYGWLQQEVIDAGQLRLTTSHQYDSYGNDSLITDARGFTTSLAFNSLNQIMRKVVAAVPFFGGPSPFITYGTDFYYDANDNVVKIEQENRNENGILNPTNASITTLIDYDLLNHRSQLSRQLPEGASPHFVVSRLVYDALDNLLLDYSPEAINGNQPDNITSYSYDTRRLLFRKTRAPASGQSSGEQLDYDENGNLARLETGASFEGASGHTTTFFYDSFDRCSGSVDAMGNVLSLAYDANNNLIWRRLDGELEDVQGSAGNRRLAELTFEYDSHDRQTRRRAVFFDPATQAMFLDGESSTSLGYAPNGALLTETNDNGGITRYAYDTAGRRSVITDARSNSVVFASDASGNVTNTTRHDLSELTFTEQIFSISETYDGLGRLTSRRDNQGNTETLSYDSRNNLIAHIDGRPTLTRYEYDSLNRPVLIRTDLNGDGSVGGPADFAVVQTWDDKSRLRAVTDSNGNTTRYDYDALDRETVTTFPDTKIMVRGWNPQNKVRSSTDANQTAVTYSYDRLDRLIRKDIFPGPGVAGDTTFEVFAYDGVSRLIRASNNVSKIEFGWDSLSNQIRGQQDGLSSLATFDGRGNRLSYANPGTVVVHNTYDTLDRLQRIGATVNGVDRSDLMVMGYDGPDRLGRVARANGINTRYFYDGVTGVPNASGDSGWRQVSTINHSRAGGSPAIDQRACKYDAAQNKIERGQISPFVQGAITKTNLYALDRLQRLIRGRQFSGNTLQNDTSYQLDKNGNRQQVQQNGAVAIYTMDPTLPEPADFQMNQYTSTPFGSSLYDGNGNLIARGNTYYAYDYADRLVQVSLGAGPNAALAATFTYDCFGRLLSKTSYRSAPLAPVKTAYFYDGDEVAELRSDTGGISTIIPDANRQHGVMVRNEQLIYFHNDDLGNNLALTSESGTVLERYDYEDFGLPLFFDANGAVTAASAIDNPFLFRGMVWDRENGFYFVVAKKSVTTPSHDPCGRSGTYEPYTGRYLSRVRQDPDLEIRNGTQWDFSRRSFAAENPWTARREVDAPNPGPQGR